MENKAEGSGFGNFEKVESRKRKVEDEKMEDRPYLEPIQADKMSSKKKAALDIRRGMTRFTIHPLK